MSVDAKALAIELVRVEMPAVLRRATYNRSLQDVLSAQESILRAHLGAWPSEIEDDALWLVFHAVQSCAENAADHDSDDETITEDALIAHIQGAR